jgi:hypothetical protein
MSCEMYTTDDLKIPRRLFVVMNDDLGLLDDLGLFSHLDLYGCLAAGRSQRVSYCCVLFVALVLCFAGPLEHHTCSSFQLPLGDARFPSWLRSVLPLLSLGPVLRRLGFGNSISICLACLKCSLLVELPSATVVYETYRTLGVGHDLDTLVFSSTGLLVHVKLTTTSLGSARVVFKDIPLHWIPGRSSSYHEAL